MPIKIMTREQAAKQGKRKKTNAPARKPKTDRQLMSAMKKGGSMKKKGMRRGGAMKSKGMAKGGKLKMVTNDKGQKVPFFAADGKGKMAKGGMMKKKGYAMGGAMKKKGMKKGGMMKKGYAKGGKVTNVASLRKIAKDMGYTISKAGGGMMKKKGMKKGGAMKRSKGGTVRGAGAATRGKRFGRAG